MSDNIKVVKGRDYRVVSDVLATVLVGTEVGEHAIQSRLPEGYTIFSGSYRFPAGKREYFVVDGKLYQDRELLGLDLRQEVKSELIEKGFSETEADNFIENLETKKGMDAFLDWDNSRKWLCLHPEYEEEAMKIFYGIKSEVSAEMEKMFKHGKRR